MPTKTKVKKRAAARPSWDEYFIGIAHPVYLPQAKSGRGHSEGKKDTRHGI